MAQEVHKFFCVHCEQTLFGETAGLLASALNRHNMENHPMSFSNWVGTTITVSAYYAAPTVPPAYLVPYTGSAAKVSDITEEDRKFLLRARVRW